MAWLDSPKNRSCICLFEQHAAHAMLTRLVFSGTNLKFEILRYFDTNRFSQIFRQKKLKKTVVEDGEGIS